jgi:hypothetical protein
LPAAIRQWFQPLMQPDNPAMSCCGKADALEADTFEVEGDHYVAVVTDGKGWSRPAAASCAQRQDGSGNPHPSMPPSRVLPYILRII